MFTQIEIDSDMLKKLLDGGVNNEGESEEKYIILLGKFKSAGKMNYVCYEKSGLNPTIVNAGEEELLTCDSIHFTEDELLELIDILDDGTETSEITIDNIRNSWVSLEDIKDELSA